VQYINANQTKEIHNHKTLKSVNALSSKLFFAPSFITESSVGRQLADRMPSDITSLARTHFANGAVFVHNFRANSSAKMQALHERQSAKKGLSSARRTQTMSPAHLSAFKPNARIGWPTASMPGKKRTHPNTLPHRHREPNRGFAKPPGLILSGDKYVVLGKVCRAEQTRAVHGPCRAEYCTRADQSRAKQESEQRRAERSRAEESRAELSRAEESRFEQEQSRTEESKAKQSRVEQRKAEKRCRGGQSRAEQRRAERCRAVC
jgi:hypothetical protein